MSTKPSKALVIPAIEETLVIPERAFVVRDEAVAKSKEVRAVFDDASRDKAISAARDLKELRLQINKFRDTAKAPIIAAGKRIEQIISDFSREIGCGSGEANQGPEEKRLVQLLNRHESEIRRQRDEEERKRQQKAEADRLAEIERQKEITRREEEAKRKEMEAEELRQKALRARSETGKNSATAAAEKAAQEAAAAQEEADRLAMEAEEAEIERQRREQEAADQSAALSIPVAGMKMKETWDYEIISMPEFAHHYPDLVKMEEKRRNILEAITAGIFDNPIPAGAEIVTPDAKLNETTMRAAPGLRIFRKSTPQIK